jgi:hypothetical protein
MAAAGLPLLKLSTLLVKTVAKPLGKYLKNESKYYPWLDRTLCKFANAIHYTNVRVNVLASGYKFVSLRRLPHDKALSDGVSIFSEGLVLGVSGVVILVESARSAAKSEASAKKAIEKEKALNEAQDRERAALDVRLTRLENAVGRRAIEREREKQEALQQQRGGGGTGASRRGGIWSWFGV